MTFKYRGTPGSLLGDGLIGSRAFLNGPARVAGVGRPASGGFSSSTALCPSLRELAPLCPCAMGTPARSLFARSLVYALPASREPGCEPDVTPPQPRGRAQPLAAAS